MKGHHTNPLLRGLFVAFIVALSSKSFAQTISADPQADAGALCKAILAKSPPAPTDSGSFQSDCDSSAYYFGIGRPKDFVAARHCAYAELAKPSQTNSNIFAGPGVLSMIYANGEGTPRNTSLARRFVCESGWSAPAELHIRLDLLDQIDKSAKPPHFDICDTATSGLSQGWCQSVDSKITQIERDRKIEQLTSTLSPNAKAAFASLKKAETSYEQARSANEVDLSGTGRAAFEFEEEDSIADEFLANLRSLQHPPPSSHLDPKEADAKLNIAYALVRQKLPEEGLSFGKYGTVGFNGVQKTERAWLQLRDRWMDFVSTAYPSYPRDTFLASITLQRTHKLKSLLESAN